LIIGYDKLQTTRYSAPSGRLAGAIRRGGAIEISPLLKADLAARLAEIEADPKEGYSWEQMKPHPKEGSWRTA